MKTNRIVIVNLVFSMLLLFPLKSFSALAAYEKTTELVCGANRIVIITKCDDVELKGLPQCGEQTIVFHKVKSGQKISTTAYGLPYDKQFDGTGTANAWQCIKGKNESYIILWYSTGGNCEECNWQGILDLNGNRLFTDMNKKDHTLFSRKWKSLGLPASGANDFTEILLRKNE